MSIKDWDGTTNNEIGKLFDWDGTTNHQMGKVYDYDGGANHLIYSAEEVLFPEQYYAWQTKSGGNGNKWLSVTPSLITAAVGGGSGTEWNNGNHSAAYSPVIDFSQYNTMKITYYQLKQNSEYGTRAKSILGILEDGASFTVYDNNGCYDDANWIWKQDYVSNNIDLAGTYTYDISNIKTVGRLWLMSYNSVRLGLFATIEATKIVLE